MEPSEDDEGVDKPPGQFMEEGHEADTRRFVEQARELARRRAADLPPWEDEEDDR